MTRETTLQDVSSSVGSFLYMGFELSAETWLIALSGGLGEEIVVRSCRAGDIKGLVELVQTAVTKLGISELAGIRSAYEAGFDGFWLHNTLRQAGIDNVVVDSASIESNARGRRRKSDRLDARQIVRKLIQYWLGDNEVWSVCRVPSRQDEDDRRFERERQQLTKERTAQKNRLGGLLKARGVKRAIDKKLIHDLDELVTGDGTPLGKQEKREIRRVYQRWSLADMQLKDLSAELDARIEDKDEKAVMVQSLVRLKGIGTRLAWGLVAELFGWRTFKNRNHLSSYVGLDSAPYDTGRSTGRTQGISKAGNRWVRAIMHSVVVNWLRWQSDSELTQWYRQKYDEVSKSERRKGLVALARKILVRLWRWVEFDEAPRYAEIADYA